MPVNNLASLIAPNILYRKSQSAEDMLKDSGKAIHVVEILILEHEFIFEKVKKQSVTSLSSPFPLLGLYVLP
jgi:hypothetical protein